jgi:hypothetical protein
VEWCRHRLGADAEAGEEPSVWREITGPEVVVPPPVPEPAVYTRPLTGYPEPPGVWSPALPGPPTGPDGWPRPAVRDRRSRRRRTALITAAGVAGGALLVTFLAWSVTEVVNRAERFTADASASATASATGPDAHASASAAGAASQSSSGAPDPGDGGRADGTPPSSAASPREPRPEPYVQVSVDAKHPVSLKDPDSRPAKGKGDIRFDCKTFGCELNSSTSVFVPLFGKPGGTLEECRGMLRGAREHTLPLAAIAAGSEICIKGPSGDIALFVVVTKSTAFLPTAFLDGDLSIWRGAA